MAIAIIFLLGVGNFSLQRSVLESGHPVLQKMPDLATAFGGRVTYVTEFCVLLAAMLFAANQYPVAAIFYAIYTALNAGGAWLLHSGRI